MEGIVAVRALDRSTIEIETQHRDARLPRKLANVPIFSVAAYQRMGRLDFSKAPVGTGSYRVESWAEGNNRVVLRGVPTSWQAPEQVDRVEIVVVPDVSSRLQSLLSGETDLANAVDPDAISAIARAGHKVSIQPGPMVLALALRTAEDAAKPLKDVRVRRALNMAIDRGNISRNLMMGTMPPATQVATPDVLGYNPDLEPFPLDRERARALLAEAGYPNGFGMVAGLMTGEVPGDRLMFQQMAQDLETIGVRVELRNIPTTDMLRRRASRSWDGIDAFSTLWSNYRLGDTSRSAEQFSCLDPTSSFCDPAMAELITTSNEELDLAKREVLLKDITARFQDLAPSILLVQFSSIDGISARVEDFRHSTGNMKFAKIRITEARK
jgi:peptide/nickel transport system substrate-binding protein